MTGTPGLRASAIQVLCNYEVAPANFTCTASVGDASGLAPAKIPTGTVSFTAPSGSLLATRHMRAARNTRLTGRGGLLGHLHTGDEDSDGHAGAGYGAYSGDSTFAPSAAKSGTGAVISPIIKSVTSTGEGASTTVSCPAGSTGCPIVASLVVEVSGGGAVTARSAKRRLITIGSTSLTIQGGRQRTVRVSLNHTGKQLLASTGASPRC